MQSKILAFSELYQLERKHVHLAGLIIKAVALQLVTFLHSLVKSPHMSMPVFKRLQSVIYVIGKIY